MKKFLYIVFSVFWLIVPSLTYFPVEVYAQDCVWFGCSNYVNSLNLPGTERDQWSALLDTIKVTINWILGMLATVALVICLYAWFKMLTSWSDSKWYDAWLKTLKNAAIGLAIIGLSRLIVSAIFWFIGNATWLDNWWTANEISSVNI